MNVIKHLAKGFFRSASISSPIEAGAAKFDGVLDEASAINCDLI